MKLLADKIKLILTFVLLSQISIAQSEKQYVEIIPGEQFKSGLFKEFFMGSHWRDVWAVPIKVEVLDLNNFAGGLTPIKKGGGFQTKSLRLMGKDGNIWKFRSMDKDPSKTLPPLLRETIAADVLKDQISSAHPLAALVVAPILDSLGVIHNPPYLVYMPGDEKLGEFKNEFGGLLGMIEIHPDVDEDENISYEKAEKISSTFKLFERLAEERDEFVNSEEYLKARLIDFIIGDWDRHTDQWKWAKYNDDDKELWHPIPRDRDQPFAKFDGLLVRIAEYMVPQFVHFGEDYPQIEDLSWSGRFLDRRVLTELDKSTWDSVTSFVKLKFTDELIDTAIKKLPPGIYELSKEELETKLKSRRDKIDEVSIEFYELINEVVDIYCSEKDDYILVERIDDEITEVKVYNRDKKSGELKGKPRFHKEFHNDLTSDIRIYLLDGDDFVKLTGEVNQSPLIRIIGGDDKDEVVDKSIVNGYWLGFTPFNKAENKTGFYDSGKKSKIDFGPGTFYNDDKVKKPDNEFEKFEPQLRDRGHDWFPKPIISFNADDGFILGGGPTFTKYNFRCDPYDYFMSLTAQYATNVKNGAVNFEGIFNSWLPNANVNIVGEWTGLKFTKYFGYGNESSYDHELEEDNFYRVKQSFFKISSNVEISLNKKHSFAIGFTYDFSDLSIDNKELLKNSPQGEYGLGKLQALKFNAGYTFDTRDNIDNAYKGFMLGVNASYTPKFFDIKSNLVYAGFDVRKYFTLKTFTHITLGLRAGGEKVWGDYPFLSAVFLGGKENLRGYSRERFSGDAAVFGQSELRVTLSEVWLILPGYLGVTGFAETGRTFINGGNSEKWHPSYGGGVWIDYLERMVTLSANVAFSSEKTALYFQLGMMF